MMVTEFFHTVRSWKAVLISLIASAMFATFVHAEQDVIKKLQGPAFTVPADQIRMPEDWQNKPITYDPAFAGSDIVINFDGQMYHAWEPIVRAYAKKNNLKIITTRGTCGVSAGGIANKSIDIGAFCCPPGKTDRLPGLRFHTMGIAALAIIVHPDNPVDNITMNEARQIFQGRTYRWSDIHSIKDAALTIRHVGRLHCKLRPGHWRLLLDNKDLFSHDLFEVGAMPDMISQVAMMPGAIGYETLWMSRYYQDKGAVKFLEINGYRPDKPAHVITGNYPLYRVYNFTTWEGERVKNPEAGKLVEHLLKRSGQLADKYHFIPSYLLRRAGWQFIDNELIGEPE